MALVRPDPDGETRRRLRDAAARLFASHGWAGVTVRDICSAAEANIAAVNYHFDGKAGLYDEVVTAAIRLMRQTMAESRDAGTGRAAEDRLRAHVRVFLRRTAPDAPDAWAHHIMLRELTDPTPAHSRVVEDVVRPQVQYLQDIVAELLGCDAGDLRAARCAFSVHAQCVAMMNPVSVEQALGNGEGASTTPDERIDVMVDHITEFSLAGLWALARMT